jgi:hypothetical protein
VFLGPGNALASAQVNHRFLKHFDNAFQKWPLRFDLYLFNPHVNTDTMYVLYIRSFSRCDSRESRQMCRSRPKAECAGCSETRFVIPDCSENMIRCARGFKKKKRIS